MLASSHLQAGSVLVLATCATPLPFTGLHAGTDKAWIYTVTFHGCLPTWGTSTFLERKRI